LALTLQSITPFSFLVPWASSLLDPRTLHSELGPRLFLTCTLFFLAKDVLEKRADWFRNNGRPSALYSEEEADKNEVKMLLQCICVFRQAVRRRIHGAFRLTLTLTLTLILMVMRHGLCVMRRRLNLMDCGIPEQNFQPCQYHSWHMFYEF
jgi:hypothetical protein